MVKICKKCGHPPCTYCKDWCDVIVRKGKEVDLCCEGECTYD